MTPLRRLEGTVVFLSASVPADASGYEDERLDFNVDEAVIALARTLFTEGGKLVFGGHPSISPLVLTVASEYASRSGDFHGPFAFIYQSEIFRDIIPEKTLLLEQMGYGRIHWTPAAPGEVKRRDPLTARWLAPRSLEAMRRIMIEQSQPAAFLAAGGMEGVEEEVDLFRELRPQAPVYALQSTGGASARLKTTRPYVEVVDRSVKERLAMMNRSGDALRPAALYPAVMEQIVMDLRSTRR